MNRFQVYQIERMVSETAIEYDNIFWLEIIQDGMSFFQNFSRNTCVIFCGFERAKYTNYRSISRCDDHWFDIISLLVCVIRLFLETMLVAFFNVNVCTIPDQQNDIIIASTK